jgi:cobalamin biosynthesis protein CobW
MTDLTKTPVTVITGFLGAGKTTLIRHLMLNPQGKRLAVLVNEFGTMGVDGEILKSCADENCPEENILELSNGCICCTVADDFIPTLERLMAMPQARPYPDRDLGPGAAETAAEGLRLARDPLAHHRRRRDRAGRCRGGGRRPLRPRRGRRQAQREADDSLDHETPLSEVFEDQIACADIVLLSKADLAGDAGLPPPAR